MPAFTSEYEMVIGLEVHVELKTEPKSFAAAQPILAQNPTPTSVRSVWGCPALFLSSTARL